MKALRILMSCVAIASPQLVLADSAIPAQSRDIVQAVLDFCARVDPRDADSFEAFGRGLMGHRSEHDDDDRQHQRWLDPIRDALAAVPKRDAIQVCAAGAASLRPRTAEDDDRRL